MKKIRLIWILLFPFLMQAQTNLVPNGSFEMGTTPTSQAQLTNATGWIVNNTADLYQAGPNCNNNNCFSGFYSTAPGQCSGSSPFTGNILNAAHGNRYIGFGSCESAATQLTEPTACGVYRLSFWYSPMCYDQDLQINAYLLNQAPPTTLADCTNPGYSSPPFATLNFNSSTTDNSHQPGTWYYYQSDIIGVEEGLSWFSIKGLHAGGAFGDPRYMYIDDIQLTQIESCEELCHGVDAPEIIGTAPFGAMADVVVPNEWQWTVLINGGVRYRLTIWNRNGGLVYEDEDCNGAGFSNKPICWNGQRAGDNPLLDLAQDLYTFSLQVWGCDGKRTMENGGITLVYGSSEESSKGQPSLLECVDSNASGFDPYCCPDYIIEHNEMHYGERLFTADQYVEFSNVYIENYNIDPFLIQAGEYIELLPETEIQTGSNFTAEIESCDTTITKQAEDIVKLPEGYLLKDLPFSLIDNPSKLETDLNKHLISDLTIQPNPTNGNTTIQFNLSDKNQINLEIFNSHGQQIKTVVQNQFFELGTHQIQLDLSHLPAGIYFCKIQSQSQFLTKKIILNR